MKRAAILAWLAPIQPLYALVAFVWLFLAAFRWADRTF